MRNILVLYSNKNSKGKKDATGAFIPEAQKFAELQGVPKEKLVGMPLVGVSRKARFKRTLETIYVAGREAPLDMIAFFGHGWPSGIQFGVRKKDIPTLVNTINGSNEFRVCLYACLTAENEKRDRDHESVGPGTDGGFADVLRDALSEKGFNG